MTPLKDYRTHSIVISKFFQRGFFILSLFYGPLRSLYNKYVFYSKCN